MTLIDIRNNPPELYRKIKIKVVTERRFRSPKIETGYKEIEDITLEDFFTKYLEQVQIQNSQAKPVRDRISRIHSLLKRNEIF